MPALPRHWPFSRVTTTTLVLPLAVVCSFAVIPLTIGNASVGKTLLVVCGGAVVIVYLTGMVAIRFSDAITDPSVRRSLQGTTTITMGLVVWGVVVFGIVAVPATPHVDFDHLCRRSPEEAVARTSFEALGASLIFDRFGRIVSLELHDASDDSLSPLRDLHHVRDLILDSSPITDAAMPHFGHLRTLEHLDLSRTGVTDEFLRSSSNFPSLQSLELSDTGISDIGLQHLSHLSSLEELWLSRTKISDSGMPALGGQRALRRLHLDSTSVSRKGLCELDRLKLTELYVQNTAIDDDALLVIGEFTTLEQLYLSNTAVTDVGLKAITRLTNLWNLELTGTQISDSGLLQLVDLRRLKVLRVRGTDVTPDGVDAFVKAIPGCTVGSSGPD